MTQTKQPPANPGRFSQVIAALKKRPEVPWDVAVADLVARTR